MVTASKQALDKRRAPQPPNGCREWLLAIAMITLPVILMLVGYSQSIQEESITNILYESSSILTTATLTSSIKQLHIASKGRSSTATCVAALVMIIPMFISGAQCALHGFIWPDWVPDDDVMGLALATSTLASLGSAVLTWRHPLSVDRSLVMGGGSGGSFRFRLHLFKLVHSQ